MFKKRLSIGAMIAALSISSGAVIGADSSYSKPLIVEGKTTNSLNKVSQKKRRIRARRAGKFN